MNCATARNDWQLVADDAKVVTGMPVEDLK